MEYEKNPDGTDKLDENGQPIPVEITDDKDKENAKIIGNLVEELKESRLKLSITQSLLDKKNEPPVENKPLTDEEKLRAIVTGVLSEQAASNAQNNKKLAFEKFVLENKEFHPENDPTGLKMDALKKKFDEFNTISLSSVDEFSSKIRDAKTLLLGNDKPTEASRGRNLDSFPTPQGGTKDKKDDELSPKELKLIQMTGKTKEQILKLKVKNPEFLEGLLQHVRD